MHFFDINSDYNLLKVKYSNYGKVNGLLLAHKCNLSVATKGWICSSDNDNLYLPVSKYKYVCRPDAPKGLGNKLPRGRDLNSDEILTFYKEIKRKCEKGILLIFEQPSVQLIGQYLPRYQTSGGVTVVIRNKKEVNIEFVGPGFDVGDLTRGKTVHSSLSIPVSDIFEIPRYLYRLNKENIIGTRYDISEKEYKESRAQRIEELKTKLGEITNIEKYIPLKPTFLSLSLFKTLLLKCVEPILFSNDPQLNKVLCIMLNIYGTMFFVFEIYSPNRTLGEIL